MTTPVLDRDLERPETRPATTPRTTGRTVAVRRVVGLLVVVLPVGWAVWRSLGGETDVVNVGGSKVLGRLFAGILEPNLDPEFLRIVFDASVTTILFAALGTAGALVIGAVGGLVLSDAVWQRPDFWPLRIVRISVRAVLVTIRAVHEIVWALLLVTVMGLDPLVAVLAIALPFGAQTAQVFGDSLDNAPRAGLLALREAGARPAAAVAYGLLPAARGVLTSYSFYRFECAIRSAVVLGFVGVGGLGQELTVSLQSRNWDEVWVLIGAVLLISAVIDSWSSWVRRDQHVSSCSDWSAGTEEAETTPIKPAESTGPRTVARTGRRWSSWSVFLVLPLLVYSWIASGVSLAGLTSERTRTETVRLLEDLWPPAMPPEGRSVVFSAVLDTVAMAIVAMVLAVLVTALLAPLAMRPTGPQGHRGGLALRVPRYLGWALARAALLVLRSIPPTVWAILALFVFFPGIVPGAIALGLYTGGILGRLVSEAWESQSRDSMLALRSAGVRGRVAGVMAMGPSSAHHLITYTLYRFEICIRDTAVVGVVGAAGLGRVLFDQLNVFRFEAVATLLIASVLISLASEQVSRGLRRYLRA